MKPSVLFFESHFHVALYITGCYSSCTVVHVLEIADDGRSGRIRAIGRCLAAAVEEAGAQEDGVMLPKEGSEAAERYDWREEWYPLYLSKEVPEDAALPITVFDRLLVLFLPSMSVSFSMDQ